jgi:hypothetical protein
MVVLEITRYAFVRVTVCPSAVVKTLLPGIITGAFAGEGAALMLTAVTAAESPVLLLEPHADKQETSNPASSTLMYLEVIS